MTNDSMRHLKKDTCPAARRWRSCGILKICSHSCGSPVTAGNSFLPRFIISCIFLSAEVPTDEHRKISWRPDVKQSSSLDGAVVTLNFCHAVTHLSPLNHRSIAANGRRTYGGGVGEILEARLHDIQTDAGLKAKTISGIHDFANCLPAANTHRRERDARSRRPACHRAHRRF